MLFSSAPFYKKKCTFKPTLSYTQTPHYRRLKRLFCNYDLDLPSVCRSPNQRWLKSYEYDFYFFSPNKVRTIVDHFEGVELPTLSSYSVRTPAITASPGRALTQSSHNQTTTERGGVIESAHTAEERVDEQKVKPCGLPLTKGVQAPLTIRRPCREPHRRDTISSQNRTKLPVRSSSASKSVSIRSNKNPITSSSLTSARSRLKRAQSTTDLVQKEYLTPHSYTTYEGSFTKSRYGTRDYVREIIKHFEADWTKL